MLHQFASSSWTNFNEKKPNFIPFRTLFKHYKAITYCWNFFCVNFKNRFLFDSDYSTSSKPHTHNLTIVIIVICANLTCCCPRNIFLISNYLINSVLASDWQSVINNDGILQYLQLITELFKSVVKPSGTIVLFRVSLCFFLDS